MVASLLADELQVADSTYSKSERFITVEGEHATSIDISGIREAQRIEIALAIMWGDDWYATIEGVTTPAWITQLRRDVRELAAHYSLGLGAIRRRRYRYDPPVGWVSQTRGLIDEWRRPGDTSVISMFAARPVHETAAGAVDRALYELVVDGFRAKTDQHVPLTTPRFPNGLARFVTGMRGEATLHHDVVVLSDERFHYVCRLESPAQTLAQNRSIFATLVDTIEPIPQPLVATAVDPALSASWVD